MHLQHLLKNEHLNSLLFGGNVLRGPICPQFAKPLDTLIYGFDSCVQGYSMAVAQTSQGPLTILGAPRYQHRGAVMTVQENNQHKRIDPNPLQVCIHTKINSVLKKQKKSICSILVIDNLLLSLMQSGAYFGAEVCAMDTDGDSSSDLILISSPMFIDTDREGRVYVCSLSYLVNYKLLLTFYSMNFFLFSTTIQELTVIYVLPDCWLQHRWSICTKRGCICYSKIWVFSCCCAWPEPRWSEWSGYRSSFGERRAGQHLHF